MKIDITIKPLGDSGDVEDKHMFYVTMSTYKSKIEGRFEKSELRLLMQTIDNAII